MKKKSRKNIYIHAIELKKLTIENSKRDIFRQNIEKIPYRGYEVENITDGRKIVISKPGGKSIYGSVKREDFLVFIYEPSKDGLWLISHKNISEDFEEKASANPKETIKIIEALDRVFNGEEPDKVLKEMILINPRGEKPEVLLKAYKWIWGQEDSNYPAGEGREMSMKFYRELKTRLLNNS